MRGGEVSALLVLAIALPIGLKLEIVGVNLAVIGAHTATLFASTPALLRCWRICPRPAAPRPGVRRQRPADSSQASNFLTLLSGWSWVGL
ncbi:hypothetical protein ACVBEG_27770 [Pseudomonas sp. GG8]